MREAITVSMKPDMRCRIDSLREDVPRSRFIIRLLESALEELNNKNMKKEKTIPIGQNSLAATDQAGINC